jgi:4a-hydroxytetrahydrobiopterin dehydratase
MRNSTTGMNIKIAKPENEKGTNMTLLQKSCVPCQRGSPSLTEKAEDDLFHELSQWELGRKTIHRLTKQFSFSSFMEAVGFVKSVAIMAEDENHHPSMCINYRTVTIELTTHAVKGLSENDFIMAAKIDALYTDVLAPAPGALESAML